MSALFVMNRDCHCGGHFELVVCEHGIQVGGECVRCQAKAAATELLEELINKPFTFNNEVQS